MKKLCRTCRGSGYGRGPFGEPDPDDVCETCSGSGVEE